MQITYFTALIVVLSQTCAALPGAYDNEATWTCDIVLAPIRRNGDTIECLSLNGRDCLWTGSKEECETKINEGPPVPLVCGNMHKQAYGITGFESPNHWCYKGAVAFGLTDLLPPPWTCDVVLSPIRRNGNTIECLSLNGRDCLWSGNKQECESQIGKGPEVPLVCGEMHKRNYGITGFESPNHWCHKGAVAFGLTDLLPPPWTCDVVLSPIRRNGDTIECLSLNGRDCLWSGNKQECESQIGKGPEVPLVCGDMHKRNYGITGFESPEHWCYKGAVAFGLNQAIGRGY